jgi:hypothetical protein
MVGLSVVSVMPILLDGFKPDGLGRVVLRRREMHEGGCLCGAVRYRADGHPRGTGICHCATCRRAASAPSLPFATFARAQFVFTQGEPATFRSSPNVKRHFCGECGSPLTYENERDPETLDVMIGSLDHPDHIEPDKHVWMSEKIAWDVVADGRPAHPKAASVPS